MVVLRGSWVASCSAVGPDVDERGQREHHGDDVQGHGVVPQVQRHQKGGRHPAAHPAGAPPGHVALGGTAAGLAPRREEEKGDGKWKRVISLKTYKLLLINELTSR